MFGLFKKKVKKTEVYSHADYNIIFENKIVDGIPVELLEIGNVKVPSGRIVVCDPLVVPNAKPLKRKVETGEFPVKIYVAKTENSGDKYAVAKLELKLNRAVKWVLAVREGEDINKLQHEDEFYGFPVDAGLGGFFDKQAGAVYLNFLDDFVKKNPNGNIYDDFFAAEFKKNAKDQNDPEDIGDWINFQLPNSELNITMFHSGYGDGVYPAYWGIDENGEVVSLVIDFFVLLSKE